MDKITHQVRAEHWAKIMNECINSGMSKTAWCRANGISVKQFFYWQRILRREAFENSQNSLLPATAGPHQEMAPQMCIRDSISAVVMPVRVGAYKGLVSVEMCLAELLAQLLRPVYGQAAVSYTQLDVYKRQGKGR